MTHQRITLNPLSRMMRPNGPHDGIPVQWDTDRGPLPDLPEGEAWAEIHERPGVDAGFDPATMRMERVLEEIEGQWWDGWRLIDLTPEEIAARNRPAPVTKLTLMNRLVALGKWETFKAALAAAPAIVQDAWTLAQDIRADDPLFVANREGFRAALGLSEDEFDNLLKPTEP